MISGAILWRQSLLHLNALLKQSDNFHYLAAFQHLLVSSASLRGCDPHKMTLGHKSSYPKLDANCGIAFTRPLLNADSPDMENSKQTNKKNRKKKKSLRYQSFKQQLFAVTETV